MTPCDPGPLRRSLHVPPLCLHAGHVPLGWTLRPGRSHLSNLGVWHQVSVTPHRLGDSRWHALTPMCPADKLQGANPQPGHGDFRVSLPHPEQALGLTRPQLRAESCTRPGTPPASPQLVPSPLPDPPALSTHGSDPQGPGSHGLWIGLSTWHLSEGSVGQRMRAVSQGHRRGQRHCQAPTASCGS